MLPPAEWESVCSSSTSRNITPAVLQHDDDPDIHNTSSCEDGERGVLLEPTNSTSTVDEARHIGKLTACNKLALP